MDQPPTTRLRDAGTDTDGIGLDGAALERRLRGLAEQASDLGSLIDEFPGVETRPAVLDAAIRAALDRAEGGDRAAQADYLRAAHPELRGAIDRAVWLDEVLGAFSPPVGAPATAPAAPPEELGPLLDDGRPRYRVRSLLGRGTRAGVYLAEDRLLSEGEHAALVAIKLLSDAGGAGTARALREARRMRLVDHPGVVRVLDVCAHVGQPAFIVQEYVDGETLEAWLGDRAGALRGSASGRRRVARLIAELADGVQALHAAGLAHRDLSPRNVMVDAQGQVRLTDFGSVDRETAGAGVDGGRGDDGSGGGTLAFLAPERLLDPVGGPLPASDVFSLGAMLFWALTGRSVYGSNAADAIAVCTDPARRIPGVQKALSEAGVGRDLRAIVARAASFGFGDRHDTASALAGDLRRWLGHRPIAWTRPGLGRRFGLLVRRRPMVTAGAAVLLVAVGVAANASLEAERRGDEAREQAHAAALAAQKLETEREWKQKTAQSLGRLLKSFASAKQQGLEAEVLTSLWILEWSHGPTLLDDPAALAPIWDRRIATLEGLRARTAGETGGTVASRLIEPSLGLWHLRAGDAEAALAVLGPGLDYWSGVCAPDDPWLLNLEVLAAAARVELASGAADAGVDDGSALGHLRWMLEQHGAALDAPIRELAAGIAERR